MDRLEIASGWKEARLEAVRRLMDEEGVAALVVPRWNRHQSEYCAVNEELLAWISGFSGTWGVGFIGREKAAIFVDGRYTVQAAQEVACAFSRHHLYEEEYEQWLANILRRGERLGFDPLVVNPAMLARLEKAAADHGFELLPLSAFPIASAWHDRPAPPFAPAMPFPAENCGETSASKRQRLAESLQASGTDILVESQLDNIAWLLNWRGGDVPDNPFVDAFVIADRDGRIDAFVDEIKLQSEGFELDGVVVQPIDAFAACLEMRISAGQQILSDAKFSPALVPMLCKRNRAKFVADTSPITRLKSIKNAVEIAGMRAASLRDSVAWVEMLSWLQTAVPQSEESGALLNEGDAECAFEANRRSFPQWVSASFRTISASGANGAMCHYNAPSGGGAPLTSDRLFLLDSGAQFLDGTTDTTRTICFGEAKPEWRRCYTLVLKGHIRLSTIQFPPGTKGYQLDAFAREALWAHGLDYDHGTGHGVGHFLSVHEHPQRIGKEPLDEVLAAGMTITNEPGYYRPGEFGIRIENLCEIVETNDGFLRLQPMAFVPLDRKLIDIGLLTTCEISWVDDYHRATLAKLRDLVRTRDASHWLAEATLPLA